MFAFDVLEKIESVIGPIEYKISGNTIHVSPALNDEQMDIAMSVIANHVGMVDHIGNVTTIELI